MIELSINGQEVVLPEGFSITVIEENPIFTKNGKKTYDITISLEDPQNTKVYNHRNRLNWKKNNLKNRTAYLVVDNEVVLNGTEKILKWSDRSVTIQLLSGNSELNFLIGGDRKLRELPLGEADVFLDMPTGERQYKIFQDLYKTYPEKDWHFLPYCAGNGDVNLYPPVHEILHIGNFYLLVAQSEWGETDVLYPTFFPFRSGSVPQPYLCFVIQKVIESLGYTLIANSIANHPVLKNLYIVHGFRTTHFAKMLPSWTVEEFLDNIEKWLDCTFLVDSYKKTVRLLLNYKADSENLESIDLEVLDEYEAEGNQDEDKSIYQSNVGYALDDNHYCKYMRLDDKIKKHPKYKEVPIKTLTHLIGMVDFTIEEDYGWVNTPEDTPDRFIFYKNGDKNSLRKVDSFRNMYNNPESEDLDIEHNIIPASMKYTYLSLFAWLDPRPQVWIQIPIAEDYDELIDVDGAHHPTPENQPLDIQSVVDGDSSISDDSSSYDKMRLALYSGIQNVDIKTKDNTWGFKYARYPIPFVESLVEYFPETLEEKHWSVPYVAPPVNPFRWDYLTNEIYKQSSNIDTSNIYRLDFIYEKKMDIMSKFIANNKLFRCVKIERTITSKGFNKIAKGEFYAVDN